MSTTSARSRGSSYGDAFSESDYNPDEDLWKPKRLTVANPDPPVAELHLERRESISTQNTATTLALDYRGSEEEIDPKTPRVTDLSRTFSPMSSDDGLVGAGAGTMASLLQSLLQKVSVMELNQPTVMAADHAALQKRVAELEARRRSRDEQYEALLELRNGDLENLIKVRNMLADERREHDALKRLRDDDLSNVYSLRCKLADTTWALAKTAEVAEIQRPVRPVSVRQSIGAGDDLWRIAQTAALEQRVLELEKANKELREKAPRKVPSSTDDVIERMERMLEDSLRYREKMGAKIQQLRSEKEVLQRDLAVMEDRNGTLESVVERLQRRSGL